MPSLHTPVPATPPPPSARVGPPPPSTPSVSIAEPAIPAKARRVFVTAGCGIVGLVLAAGGAILGLIIAFRNSEPATNSEPFVGVFELAIDALVGLAIGYGVGTFIAVLVCTIGSVLSWDKGLGGISAFIGALIPLPFLFLAIFAI